MLKFFSRKETAPLPDRLVPYGWSGAVKQVHDDLGWYEQERARIDGRGFGRRATAPERQSLITRRTATDRVKFVPADPDRTALLRHPGSLFRR